MSVLSPVCDDTDVSGASGACCCLRMTIRIRWLLWDGVGRGGDAVCGPFARRWARGVSATRRESYFLMGRSAVFVWFGTAWTAFLVVCDTPVVVLCFKGFGGVGLGRVCVGGWVGVSYSLAAGRRGSPRWGGSGWPSGGGLRTQERVCTTF